MLPKYSLVNIGLSSEDWGNESL